MHKARAALSELLSCPADERIAAEGVIQRITGAIVMHEKFVMA